MKAVSVFSFIIFFTYFFLGGALFSLTINRRQKALIFLTASFILRAIWALGPSLMIYNVPIKWTAWITGPIKVSLIPLTFLFLEYLIDSDKKFGKRNMVHFIPVLLNFIFTIFIASGHAGEIAQRTSSQANLFGISWQGNFYYTLLATTARAICLFQALFYSGVILSRIRHQLGNRNTEHPSANHRFLLWTKGIYFLFVITGLFEGAALLGIYQFAAGFMAWILFLIFNAFYLFIYVVLFKPATPSRFHAQTKQPAPNKLPVNHHKEVVSKEWLKQFISRELFLNPDLSLQETCFELAVQKHKLPQLIKDEGYPNFYSFVNHYRIEKSKELLMQLSSTQVIESIIADSGFKSRSTFFRVFKDNTGITPGEYWHQQRNSGIE